MWGLSLHTRLEGPVSILIITRNVPKLTKSTLKVSKILVYFDRRRHFDSAVLPRGHPPPVAKDISRQRDFTNHLPRLLPTASSTRTGIIKHDKASKWAPANKALCTILSLLLLIAVLVFATGPWVQVSAVSVTAGITADSESPASSSISGNPQDVEGFGDAADWDSAGIKAVFGFPWPWSLELIENRFSSSGPGQYGFKLPEFLWRETLQISLSSTPWALRTDMAVTRRQWFAYYLLSPAASDMVFIIVARVFFPIGTLQYHWPLLS